MITSTVRREKRWHPPGLPAGPDFIRRNQGPGGGTPLFGRLDSAIGLERTGVLVTPAATHLTYRVVR